jgi:hypothetical protein
MSNYDRLWDENIQIHSATRGEKLSLRVLVGYTCRRIHFGSRMAPKMARLIIIVKIQFRFEVECLIKSPCVCHNKRKKNVRHFGTAQLSGPNRSLLTTHRTENDN